jgi:hypothetical protein
LSEISQASKIQILHFTHLWNLDLKWYWLWRWDLSVTGELSRGIRGRGGGKGVGTKGWRGSKYVLHTDTYKSKLDR